MTPAERQYRYRVLMKQQARFEKIWQPRILAALRKQAEPFIEYMLRNGPEAALYIIDSLILPDAVEKVLRQLYRTVGVQAGNEEYGHLLRTYPEKINQGKAFGFNDFWRGLLNAFYELVGADRVVQITSTEKKRIRSVLEDAANRNLTNYELAKLLRSDAVNAARSRVIARTETGTAGAKGQALAAAQTKLIFKLTWISARRFSTRVLPRDQWDHYHMHNVQIQPGEQFFVMSKFGGEFIPYPHAENASAGNTINCRCVAIREAV